MLIPFEVTKDNLTHQHRPIPLDLEAVCGFMARSYWAQNRTRPTIERTLRNSLVFGVYEESCMVAMARIVSDYATFAWLCDVFVVRIAAAAASAKWLMESILASHRELQACVVGCFHTPMPTAVQPVWLYFLHKHRTLDGTYYNRMPVNSHFISNQSRKSLLRRHPWIFSGAVAVWMEIPQPARPVDLLAAGGQFLAAPPTARAHRSGRVSGPSTNPNRVDALFFRRRIVMHRCACRLAHATRH